MKLYLFNPEHDYALANNDAHFMAPASACKFADDCASFLSFLSEESMNIFRPYSENVNSFDLTQVTQVCPWGWNRLMVSQLQKAGVPEKVLPTEDSLRQIRSLAHRQQTLPAMDYLKKKCPNIHFPDTPQLLRSETEVANFIVRYGDAIFKAPYSGNGRGNLYAHGLFSDTLRRQTLGIIRKQGAILGEKMYSVIQDFALEFYCSQAGVSFVGYSLFQTQNYGYAGNLLLPDSSIEQVLSKWLDLTQLQMVKAVLIDYLTQLAYGKYEGYIGVDMFVYEENGSCFLNPMVEMNFRMTMGMAAHIIYERHIHAHSTGNMRLLFMPHPGDLKKFVDVQPAMQNADGKWSSGFKTLNEITEQTMYALVVDVFPL